jgi:hypothetical protein
MGAGYSCSEFLWLAQLIVGAEERSSGQHGANGIHQIVRGSRL